MSLSIASILAESAVRHADLDAYLLYNGGTVSGSAPPRPEETSKVPVTRSRCCCRTPRTSRWPTSARSHSVRWPYRCTPC